MDIANRNTNINTENIIPNLKTSKVSYALAFVLLIAIIALFLIIFNS